MNVYPLKQQILDELYCEPHGLTDNQLAIRLGANEPSVRRARRQMVVAGDIKETYGAFGYRGWVKTWALSK